MIQLDPYLARNLKVELRIEFIIRAERGGMSALPI